jgi:hypothetical protein
MLVFIISRFKIQPNHISYLLMTYFHLLRYFRNQSRIKATKGSDSQTSRLTPSHCQLSVATSTLGACQLLIGSITKICTTIITTHYTKFIHRSRPRLETSSNQRAWRLRVASITTIPAITHVCIVPRPRPRLGS